MLEGKEVEKQLGEYGSVSVDITERGELEVALAAKVDLMKEIAKVVKKTGTPVDDKAFPFLAKLFKRTEQEIAEMLA